MTLHTYDDDCAMCGTELDKYNKGYTAFVSNDEGMYAKFVCRDHSDDDVREFFEEEAHIMVHGSKYLINPEELEGFELMSGTIQSLEVYDQALTGEQIEAVYEARTSEDTQ